MEARRDGDFERLLALVADQSTLAQRALAHGYPFHFRPDAACRLQNAVPRSPCTQNYRSGCPLVQCTTCRSWTHVACVCSSGGGASVSARSFRCSLCCAEGLREAVCEHAAALPAVHECPELALVLRDVEAVIRSTAGQRRVLPLEDTAGGSPLRAARSDGCPSETGHAVGEEQRSSDMLSRCLAAVGPVPRVDSSAGCATAAPRVLQFGRYAGVSEEIALLPRRCRRSSSRLPGVVPSLQQPSKWQADKCGAVDGGGDYDSPVVGSEVAELTEGGSGSSSGAGASLQPLQAAWFSERYSAVLAEQGTSPSLLQAKLAAAFAEALPTSGTLRRAGTWHAVSSAVAVEVCMFKWEGGGGGGAGVA
jgi:hypothetical protein